MQTLFQLTLTALQIGSVYVLFALGLTLIFGVLRIVNFAHGQFFTLSALIVSVAIPWLVAGVVLASALGALAFRRFQRDLAGSFILSAGFVLLFEGVFRDIFGGAVRSVLPLVDGNVAVFGATLAAQRLILCAVAVALAGGLLWSLNATRLGRAMRAVSIDHEAAMLQGIPYNAIAFRGLVVAPALGAIAGALIAPVSIVSPEFGESYLVKGFIAVVIGGLGSVPGAILGSLFIAFIESFGGFYFDPSSANLAIFVLVMLVLLIRPKGVFGHA
ncbi:putative branched-chain amino acid transport system permease protein [Candidatus Paraburkholderia kirkii]|nr:putative branched-chain amino acid transport system permease protein [Candidatus Paraburkholderia kirkii]